MSRFDSSHVNSASNKQAQQNVASRGYNTWLLVDLCLMLLVTVVLFIVLLTVETLSDFLKLHHYLLFIFLILGVILLGLILFVHKIRSQYVAVRLLLAIVVVLWSVSLAIAFTSFEWAFLWMSLVITIVLTITTVVLALKLPPLSEKGFILFIVMSIVFATLAFITKFVNYFIPETSNLLKSIICNFGTVFAVSFIVLMIFLLIGLRHWIIWFFAPQPSEFILAFLVWFLIIILFTETYTSLELCIPKNDTKRGTSGHKDTHFLALQTI